jgi:hypothetical protein
MSFYGKLSTMSLPDLLQWASGNKRTGILELERNKISRRIAFREGHIVACSSDDPPALLGQFLLSRGKINRENLREALGRQAASGETLGTILEKMGLMTRSEIESQVAAKAEENIYGLFDWTDAVFRFLENAPLDRHTIEVNLSVEDILMRGAQRRDELQRIRKVLRHSGIVLRRTDQPVPSEVTGSPMARRILESINGERALAEVLLHAHASEYLVIKFLFMLHGRGIIEISGEQPVDPQAPTLLDTIEVSVEASEPAATPDQPEAEQEQPPDAAGDVDEAVELISRKEYAAALDILDRLYRAEPDDNHLRHMLFQAESGYREAVLGGALSPTKIPVRLPIVTADLKLQPAELFLLDMLDGETDIQSISWVAPLREVDVLRALQSMLKKGLIELRDPDPSREGQETESPVKAVKWSPF